MEPSARNFLSFGFLGGFGLVVCGIWRVFGVETFWGVVLRIFFHMRFGFLQFEGLGWSLQHAISFLLGFLGVSGWLCVGFGGYLESRHFARLFCEFFSYEVWVSPV